MALGPAEDIVLLPIVNRAELEELRLEDVTLLSEVAVEEVSEVLEDPVPVGPVEYVVLFPMAKRAELEELRLNDRVLLLEAVELVRVLFIMLTGAEIEEIMVGDVDMLADPVGPAEVVELPMGKGTLLLVSFAAAVEDALMLDPEVVVPLLV